ncbi:uncharacterized protein LOC112056458 isoform X1 [Bicyclus anynana]|uniref:Uncharacterized protein LOC112056458 isoform X1 n=2 Tax=Bicyclus anynana TaxID=110368 RepID=A0ABM3M8T9_BICAN|nr:uncharacterized protein LOC112056458 isoform X1 [Bicyclus anynana]
MNYMQLNGIDPLLIYFHYFETVIGGILLNGYIQNLKIKGVSSLNIESVNYDKLLGHLDLNMVMKGMQLEVDKYEAEASYGSTQRSHTRRGARAQLSGTLDISELRLVLDSVLRVTPGQPVDIVNINTDITLGDIRADFIADWKCLSCLESRDVSSIVNYLLNVKVKEILTKYKEELNTFVAQGIKLAVNRKSN